MRNPRIRSRLCFLATAAWLAASAVSLLPAGAQAAHQQDPSDQDLVAQHYARLLAADEGAIARTRAASLAAHAQVPAANWLSRYQQEAAVASADYQYRAAIRLEQVHIFDIAVRPGLESAVLGYTSAPSAPQIADTIDAYHAMWRLAGYDELNLLHIRPRPMTGALPPSQLVAFYSDAASRYELDWAYLASINFVESDFGRVAGSSSAGAQGPMQFMPATWDEYGAGGDIHSPRDSIQAAARYLFLNGGRRDMNRAVFAYNHDWDYVTAVSDYASVIRRDPSWMDRLYYWSTAG